MPIPAVNIFNNDDMLALGTQTFAIKIVMAGTQDCCH